MILAAAALAFALGVTGVAGAAPASEQPMAIPAPAGGGGRALVVLPAPEHDPDTVRRATREVLLRPEFRREQPGPLERARRWLLARLGDVLSRFLADERAGIFAWGLVAASVALIALLGVRLARQLSSDAPVVTSAGRGRSRSAIDWRREAEDHERAGRWRDAVRCRYRALLADLGNRGLVDDVPGRTAGEYEGEVRRNAPGAARAFTELTALFQASWYGRAPAGAEDAERSRSLSDDVLAATR